MRVSAKLVVAGTATCCTLSVSALPAAMAEQVAYFGGTHQNGQPSETSLTEWKSFYGGGGPVITVQYPRDLAPLVGTQTLDQSVAKGRAAAHTALGTGSDPVHLVGVSQGAVVAQLVKQDLTGTRRVVLTTYGDPTNTDGGLLGKLPVGLPGFITNYRADDDAGFSNTTYALEYDIIADAPDLPNPVSWVNALMGAGYYHHTYSIDLVEDMTDDQKVVTTVKTVNPDDSVAHANEHILLKTAKLPLVQPLRDMGVDENLVKVIEKPLKQIVDLGYTGNRTTDSTVTNPMVTGNKVSPGSETKAISKVGSKAPSLKQAIQDTRAGVKKAIDDTRATVKRLLKPTKTDTSDQKEPAQDAA